jgi:arginine-tRNA-protein transferase
MEIKARENAVLFREAFPCVYFEDGRISTIEYLIPDKEKELNYHEFLAQGYRRLGRLFYRNVCEKCSACKPIRVEAERFTISKSQKRTLKKNEDIHVEVLSHSFLTPEKIALYEKYIKSKHAEEKGEEPQDSFPVLSSIHYGYVHTIEMDYYLDSKLIAVGIVDEAGDSLSSNYFYYDTNYLDRRLGVFSILREVSLVRDMGTKYYYLGFYIEENEKMSYKKFFRPNQVYENNKWREFLI